MSIQELENEFIAEQKKTCPSMTFETEIVMRYAFSVGANRAAEIAYEAGVIHQQRTVQRAMGVYGKFEQ